MAEEGIDLETLAERCGLDARGLGVALSTGVPFAATRAKIERGFSYRHPIWSTAKTLDFRRLSLERLGFDPVIEGVRFLRKQATRIGADFSRCLTKADMESVCYGRAAVTKAAARNKDASKPQ